MSTGKNIQGVVNYNENKVKLGMAECIGENMYGRPVGRLSIHEKLRGLNSFIERNRRATTKAVHISLNFHPSEQLGKDRLMEIANEYMERIGFGEQPYLVYQHFDAAHPHLHIATTNIRSKGDRIQLFNIGRNQSESARKEIERKFQLVKAGGRRLDTEEGPRLERLRYGQVEIKRHISNVVHAVTKSYKYTSLPELNAVLRQFNIIADRGGETSQMFLKKGLLFHMTDDNGRKLGVPIKASSIYGKPTLPNLEKQFKLNELLRRAHRQRLAHCIDNVLDQTPSKTAFLRGLAKEQIFVVLRATEGGLIYGITFVDNKSKCVFNGSDLGKAFSAKSITSRLSSLSGPDVYFPVLSRTQETDYATTLPEHGIGKVMKELVTARQVDFSSPNTPFKRKRRRKRKGRSL